MSLSASPVSPRIGGLGERSPLQIAAELVGLPDGATPDYGVTIVSFIDSDPDTDFTYVTHGDIPKATLIGLLQMTIYSLILDDDDDEEEDA